MPHTHPFNAANSFLILFQVDYALELISELHPLYGTPMHDVYPALKYLCCCCVCFPSISGAKKEQREDDEEPLVGESEGGKDTIMIAGKEVKKKHKKKRKNPANIQNLEDPLDQLGFGIVAYNQMMRKFTWLFLFFSILMAPAIYFNSQGTGYAFVPAEMKSYEGNTLGNMGYSSV